MNDLSKLIRDKVPELKELTFGCRFLTEYHAHRIIGVDDRAYCIGFDGMEVEEFNPDKDELIGHPIHPHHWLPLLGGEYAIDGAGFIRVNTVLPSKRMQFLKIAPHAQYDFSKDFDSQSEEFHLFLLEQLQP